MIIASLVLLSALSVEQRVDDLLGRMTLREKVGQLNQLVCFNGPDYAVGGKLSVADRVRRGEVTSIYWGGTVKDRNDYQRVAVEESRLGIPLVFSMDVVHGASLIFPNPSGLACAFEPELFERANRVAAKEARASGFEWAFAPMCDTARDPRWGRVQESCGEDPYLNALCCAAQVRGFQGADLSAADSIVACPKHFVGYSAVTGGRDYNDCEITDWTLRNVHLPPFRAAIEEAGALTVMSCFTTIDGVPSVACRKTLTGVLRDEWRFPGFVISDWESICELQNWGFARDKREAAVLAFSAGNDMDMKGEAFFPHLIAAVESGVIDEKQVDEAVRRVLRVKFILGLFERPYADADGQAETLRRSRRENAALARECVRKSAVLLKNEGDVLPVDAATVKRVALIGPYGDDAAEMLGAWCGNGKPSSVVTLAAALRAALPGAEVEVVKGCDVNEKPVTKTLVDGTIVVDESAARFEGRFDASAAVEAAKRAEVVFVAIGEPRGMTGEGQSRSTLGATGRQQELFDAVVATGKPVVALVFAGRPLALNEVYDRAAAVLYCWQPGCEAGNGLADLLLGKCSPSGRLTMSVPYGVGHVPCFYNRAPTGRPQHGNYQDAVRRGARYPFGFGLTYSKFSYSPTVVAGKTAKATVTNVGNREATETVQLYIRQKVCRAGWRPVRELRGFRKVTLRPGASAEVSFELDDRVLGYTDRTGRRVCDPGEYEVWIVPNAASGSAGTAFVWK